MNELQLQRCIDGELNDADQAEFLKKLEQENNTAAWRALALGFVENQLFQNALTDEVPAENSAPLETRSRNNLTARRRPFSAMSILTLCLGIAAGVLLMQSFSQQGETEVVQVSGQERESVPEHVDSGRFNENIPTLVVENLEQKEPLNSKSPQPAMHLEWKTDEDLPVSLPVYSPEEYGNANRLLQSKQFPKQLQKELESRGYKVHRQPRIYRLPLDDGRQILVPTESVQVRYAVF